MRPLSLLCKNLTASPNFKPSLEPTRLALGETCSPWAPAEGVSSSLALCNPPFPGSNKPQQGAQVPSMPTYP